MRDVGDDVVLIRVVRVVVDAEDDRDVGIGRRRRDDDLLRAGFQMLRGAFSIREQTRGFDHDVDAEIAPRQRRGLALRGDLDGAVRQESSSSVWSTAASSTP